MTITEHLEAVLAEVAEMERRINAWAEAPNRKPLSRKERSSGTVLGGRSITSEGARHLLDASVALLEREKLQARISVPTARNYLNDELLAEIKRRREEGRFSYDAVVKRAADNLHQIKGFTGNCFFPAFIAYSEKTIDLTFGPVRIVSRDVFDAEYSQIIDDRTAQASTSENEVLLARILNAWKTQSEPYAFMAIVAIENFELNMARPAARQAAEFTLNLLRLMEPHRLGPRIRLAGDSKPETEQAFLAISSDGTFEGDFSQRGEQVHLSDDWSDTLLRNIGDAKPMIDAIVSRLVSGEPFSDPAVERIRYADQLFTEAFQDPSPRLALVKIVSALETLCVLPHNEKSRTIQLRYALAGSGGDPDYIHTVRASMANAYRVRNDIVHGDAPEPHEAENAIATLQRNLFHNVLHLWAVLFSIHNNKKPQSIKALRRELRIVFEADRQHYEEMWKRMGIQSPIHGLVETTGGKSKIVSWIDALTHFFPLLLKRFR